MELILKKNFRKNLKKQPQKVQDKARKVLKIFIKNENHPSLRRHALHGKKYNAYESIDVTGDIRIIIRPQTMEIVDICDIGTHAQLYK
jgi:mRNA-degrading endonuclease YafQ of YafQ-DinJ toxin-antitoxin module